MIEIRMNDICPVCGKRIDDFAIKISRFGNNGEDKIIGFCEQCGLKINVRSMHYAEESVIDKWNKIVKSE